ncbi:hypothetical protein G6O69_25395 [Pseudenhygromyxa sp. WMMC2535]|uniref:LiaF domain-containing protein n=1 Tax=Pseudenhygromyxa sp. WMMC2535 TaxID=2712867 RepID=UPI00155655B6|nr:LiaF domain-containing protein [Pseudenhygromyxa sp. WMMC2535]NVB41199.1 hypothetical protein [Pseudenhygromyxa sp. WMMC2535]
MDMDQDGQPTNLIALRDAKAGAQALITRRFAEDLIDADELDRRLDTLLEAQTLEAVAALTRDLEEPGAPPGQALARQSSGQALARLEDLPERRELTAIFSSIEEVGRWVPARHNRVTDVFADAKLDFCEAVLGPGETVVEIRCVFGSMEILVPRSLAVRVETSAVFADVSRDPEVRSEPEYPGDPVLVVRGSLVFASLEIREREAREGRWAAWRRHRGERRKLRAARRDARRRPALPPASDD